MKTLVGLGAGGAAFFELSPNEELLAPALVEAAAEDGPAEADRGEGGTGEALMIGMESVWIGY